jgi:ribonuclease T1
MINNTRAVRIIAAVLIAMLVITMAAALFGCSSATGRTGTEVDPESGLAWVEPSELPDEANDTLALIASGGPFPYPRDGAVFGNFEGLLPEHPRGYYREYTVPTPGEKNRGSRRIVAGKNGEYYYTADHYQSFRRVRVQGDGVDESAR